MNSAICILLKRTEIHLYESIYTVRISLCAYTILSIPVCPRSIVSVYRKEQEANETRHACTRLCTRVHSRCARCIRTCTLASMFVKHSGIIIYIVHDNCYYLIRNYYINIYYIDHIYILIYTCGCIFVRASKAERKKERS